MHSTGLRWTRLCVASTATALFASTSSLSAFASQKHALQSGETLDALARKYYVSVPDLIRANNIEDQDRIPDGRVLTIPAPPKSLTASPTMHHATHIRKDSVSVRLGPGLEYRRVNFVYEGDAVIVTAEQDGWAQIGLEDGKTGWVLQSLVRGNNKSEGDKTASNNEGNSIPAPAHHKPAHHAVMVAVDEERSRTRKVARRRSSDSASAHKHHAQHQEPAKSVAHSVKHHVRHQETEQAVAHSVKHHKHITEQKAILVAKQSHHTAKTRVHPHKFASEAAVSSHKRRSKHSLASQDTDKTKRHSRAGTVERTRVASYHTNKSSSHKIAIAHHNRRIQVADAGTSESRSDIVRTAYGYRGTPYVWGGERPGGFDCSGFTLHLYGKKGISLPHSARSQFEMGHRVDRSGMKPGDLVFFHTVTPGISHCGMYVGNGKFVHASSRRSGGVRVDNLDSGYYSKAFRGARRIRKGDD